jgi:hypothetical protein
MFDVIVISLSVEAQQTQHRILIIPSEAEKARKKT